MAFFLGTPKSAAIFKPRAEAGILSAMVQDAWKEYQATNFPPDERASVAAAVADHIRSLYPSQDMAFLARYGCAREIKHVSVRVHDGKDWAQSFGIELPGPIMVAANHCSESYYCGGPWFSRDPARGITAKYRATMSDSNWQKLCANQDASDRARIPEPLEPYFNKLLAARALVNSEYRTAVDWPAEFKAQNGIFPTWQQIADHFSVLGAHLQTLWKVN